MIIIGNKINPNSKGSLSEKNNAPSGIMKDIKKHPKKRGRPKGGMGDDNQDEPDLYETAFQLRQKEKLQEHQL